MHKGLFIYKDGQSGDKACTTYASGKFFDDGLAIKVYEGDEVSTFEQKNGFTGKIVPDPELKGAVCPTGAKGKEGKMKTKKIVILPVQEPYASMLATGYKIVEFRKYPVKGKPGQEVGIVATGNAEKPRKVIAKLKFYRCLSPNNIRELRKKGMLTPFTSEKGGNNRGEYGGAFFDKHRGNRIGETFTLESIGIKRTPMKYQYFYEEANNG